MYVGLSDTPPGGDLSPHFKLTLPLCFPPVTPYKGPRNLQTSDPSRTSFRVTWDHAPGDVKGYKVRFHPVGEDIDLGELLVGPYDNTVVLEELRCVIRMGFFLFLTPVSSPYGYKKLSIFWPTELVPSTQ